MNINELYTNLKAHYDRDSWKEIIDAIFPARDFFATPEDIIGTTKSHEEYVQRLEKLGEATTEDDRNIVFYEVELKQSRNINFAKNRVSLRNLVQSEIVPYLADGAFIAFHQPGNDQWRFSFLSKTENWDDEGNIVKEETHPQRYTFLVGPSETCKTPTERIEGLIGKSGKINMEDLLKAFSVEPVSDAFFKEYKEHYQNFVEYLSGKRLVKEKGKWKEKKTGKPHPLMGEIFNDKPKLARDFAKKLLGRLVFLYFVQKKGWMLVPGEKDPEKELNLIQAIFDKMKDNGKFYQDGLLKLFFGGLNEERKDNEFKLPDGAMTQVPFLNGGLFYPDILDVRAQTKELNFPSHIFSNPNYQDIPQDYKSKAETTRGFLDFLNAYNFTIDEDSPGDHTIAVDPEMLGHIFENLLEDNKEKGAYYTPKRVVHFMCQEAISEYLIGKFPDRKDEVGDSIKEFIRFQRLEGITNLDIEEDLLTHLKNVKVCDPAIGSGAFPMGILQEIVQAIQTIGLVKPGAVADIWKVEEENPSIAKIKLEIIQNSIYGVDVDSGAVDIARLRFWLSLIVDEEEPQALPNFDYKIVVGNSLLSKYEDKVIALDWKPKTGRDNTFVSRGIEIGKLKKQYFDPETQAEKGALEVEIRSKTINLLEHEINIEKRKLEQKLAGTGNLFGASKTKDEKIEEAKVTAKVKRLNEVLDGLQKEKSSNDPLPYFDWHVAFPEILMPGVAERRGFDIVIANPPYMRVQEITKTMPTDKPFLEEKFKVAKGSYDLANMFFELATWLSAEECHNAFIFPHKFFNAASGEAFRDFLMEGKFVDKIAHFGANMVFKDADTYTCVTFFSKAENEGFECQKFPLKSDFYTLMEDPLKYNHISYLELEAASIKYGANQWIFFNQKEEYEIFQKIYLNSKKFEKVFLIFVGLQTSGDAFFLLKNGVLDDKTLTGETKDPQESFTVESELFKPMLMGKDVHRYESLSTNSFVFFPYEIEPKKATVIPLLVLKNKFPKSYSYVKRFENEFKGRENGVAKKWNPWYKHGRENNLYRFGQVKLSSMEICSSHPNVTLNDQNLYHSTTVYSWVKNKDVTESYSYLLAIANSSMIWWFLMNTGDTLQGDARRFKSSYLNPFPLPQKISTETDRIFSEKVKQIMDLKTTKGDTNTLEKEIDAMVCRLYNLTYGEAKLVDPKIPHTESTYNALVVQ